MMVSAARRATAGTGGRGSNRQASDRNRRPGAPQIAARLLCNLWLVIATTADLHFMALPYGRWHRLYLGERQRGEELIRIVKHSPSFVGCWGRSHQEQDQ